MSDSTDRFRPHLLSSALDAQSTHRSPQDDENGYDAGKKVKGRKRHFLLRCKKDLAGARSTRRTLPPLLCESSASAN